MRTLLVAMRSCHLLLLFAAACGHEAAPAPRPVAGSGSAVTPAPTGPIQLTAAAAHGVLELTFTNPTSAPVTIASHVIGGEQTHYDWLVVELEGGGGNTRKMHFIGPRKESETITADIAPGAAHTAQIDLVQWAIATGNGGPLLPGTYALRASWDSSGEPTGTKVVATATTTLVVEAPGAEGCAVAGYKAPA